MAKTQDTQGWFSPARLVFEDGKGETFHVYDENDVLLFAGNIRQYTEFIHYDIAVEMIKCISKTAHEFIYR